LEVQGGPGEGNIRGIGGERRVERRRVNGVGVVEGMYQRLQNVAGDWRLTLWQCIIYLHNFQVQLHRETSSLYSLHPLPL